MEPPTIQQLDEAVVNRIAAGEVIQRPWNAVKELVENCLDAGASSITVTVKEGGLRLLQVTDNGCGVARADLPLLCQRFATSKLREYDDLRCLDTFGFRGEALASISHVAHVTVTSRPHAALVAHRATYHDGKLDGPVVSCASNPGTCVSAAELFYNVPTRRRALRSTAEEHGRVLDVLTKYAIHRASVAWTLKKEGGGPVAVELRTMANATACDNVRALYGNSLARELLEVSHRDEKLGLQVQGLVSNANYNSKKLQLLLFINERLVDSAILRRALSSVYVALLPKQTHPWLYLALQLPAATLDVNVHPTKHEVHFLHEEAVAIEVQSAVERVLLASGQSRAFYTKNLVPPTLSSVAPIVERARASVAAPAPCKMVRTDAKQHKITAFYGRPAAASKPLVSSSVKGSIESNSLNVTAAGVSIHASPMNSLESDGVGATAATAAGVSVDNAFLSMDSLESDGVGASAAAVAVSVHAASPPINSLESDAVGATITTETTTAAAAAAAAVSVSDVCTAAPLLCPGNDASDTLPKDSSIRRDIRLASVAAMCEDVRKNCSSEIRNVLRNAVWVGSVDRGRALVQHDTQLLLLDMRRLSQDFFCQQLYFEFGNLGVLRLSEPASLEELARLALMCPSSGWRPQDGSQQELANFAARLLREKAAMLWDYFSLQIDEEGHLVALPLLLEGYVPDLDALPLYVLRLATEVEWDQEEACFRTFCHETARFYAAKPTLFANQEETKKNKEKDDDGDDDEEEETWRWCAEHVLFKVLRTSYLPNSKLENDGSMLQVASLPELYKVFERC